MLVKVRDTVLAILLALAVLATGYAIAERLSGHVQTYATTCTMPAKGAFPVTCNLNPTARYDYRHGAWQQVPDDYTYPNGHRAPSGAEIMAMGPNGP